MARKPAVPEPDGRVLQLFLAGATYDKIAGAVGLTVDAVREIVLRDLDAGSARRAVLTNKAVEVNQERTEALFRAHWGPALSGDHRSAELCRRILERQAMAAEGGARSEGDAVDEIAARRAARRAGPTPRARARRQG